MCAKINSDRAPRAPFLKNSLHHPPTHTYVTPPPPLLLSQGQFAFTPGSQDKGRIRRRRRRQSQSRGLRLSLLPPPPPPSMDFAFSRSLSLSPLPPHPHPALFHPRKLSFAERRTSREAGGRARFTLYLAVAASSSSDLRSKSGSVSRAS